MNGKNSTGLARNVLQEFGKEKMMTNREKVQRALVLMDMAIELLEEVDADMDKVVVEQIRKGFNHIDVVAKVK